MKRSIAALGIALSLGLAGGYSARATCIDPNDSGCTISERFVVEIGAWSDVQTVLAILQQRWPGTTLEADYPVESLYLFRLPVGISEDDVVLELLATRVAEEDDFGDPNRPLLEAELLARAENPGGSTGSIYSGMARTDAAELFSNQYAGQAMGLGPAHTIATGARVLVAVLDTGIDATHPSLASRTVPGVNMFTSGGPTGDTAPGLLRGHGTFVASLVALAAPDARLMPIVVLDPDGRGDSFRVAAGIYEAVARGADVVNLSLAARAKSDLVENAIAFALSQGVVVVAAGGNEGVERVDYPARLQLAIGVAALNDQSIKAPFSNSGSEIGLSAPGDTIVNQFGNAILSRSVIGAVPGDGFATWDGTSLSAGLVSGAAAVLRSQYAAFTPDLWLAEQVRADLIASATNIDTQNPAYSGKLGAGLVNLAAATALAPPPPARGDVDGDGFVGLNDLLEVLGGWGLSQSRADLDGDGLVELDDLLEVLGHFGL
jgi:subtilisin family serine protease